jgi:hypothetical protein
MAETLWILVLVAVLLLILYKSPLLNESSTMNISEA